MENEKDFLQFLLKRFQIEGSTLTEEQTASLFDNGTLPKSDDYYRAKDVAVENSERTYEES